MARITVEDCLDNIDNIFEMVLVAAKRARRVAHGADAMVELENDKPTVIALREIAEGLVTRAILEEIEQRIPGFPIVLHGASSVIPKYVEMINSHGGKLDDAVGIPEEQLRKAARSAVCKVNIDSDGRLAVTAAIRKVLTDEPGGCAVHRTQVEGL